ncbi:MAG: amidohydrolase family protein [Clostridium sp.]
MLKIATRGSASILGRDDIGQIAEGMAADFFLINMDRAVPQPGAQFDVSSMLGAVGYKGNVDYTVVNGESRCPRRTPHRR